MSRREQLVIAGAEGGQVAPVAAPPPIPSAKPARLRRVQVRLFRFPNRCGLCRVAGHNRRTCARQA